MKKWYLLFLLFLLLTVSCYDSEITIEEVPKSDAIASQDISLLHIENDGINLIFSSKGLGPHVEVGYRIYPLFYCCDPISGIVSPLIFTNDAGTKFIFCAEDIYNPYITEEFEYTYSTGDLVAIKEEPRVEYNENDLNTFPHKTIKDIKVDPIHVFENVTILFSRSSKYVHVLTNHKNNLSYDFLHTRNKLYIKITDINTPIDAYSINRNDWTNKLERKTRFAELYLYGDNCIGTYFIGASKIYDEELINDYSFVPEESIVVSELENAQLDFYINDFNLINIGENLFYPVFVSDNKGDHLILVRFTRNDSEFVLCEENPYIHINIERNSKLDNPNFHLIDCIYEQDSTKLFFSISEYSTGIDYLLFIEIDQEENIRENKRLYFGTELNTSEMNNIVLSGDKLVYNRIGIFTLDGKIFDLADIGSIITIDPNGNYLVAFDSGKTRLFDFSNGAEIDSLIDSYQFFIQEL